jgi:hypothetical protein
VLIGLEVAKGTLEADINRVRGSRRYPGGTS